jgi:hypothetical protein
MKADLFPLNHQRLTHAGIKFTRLKAEEELVVACPCCGGKLSIHAQQPWHICFGDVHCPATGMGFGQILNALAQEARKP